LRTALLAGRRDGRRGAGATAPRRSDGYEFAELREYVEGDDPRRIDWAATARAGALQTRVILEERSLVLAAVVDASGSMQVGRTRGNYESACELARAWYAAAADDDRCARIGARALYLRDAGGRAGAAACASERDLDATSLGTSLRVALAVLPRAARVLVVSDFYEYEALERELRTCATRFDVSAFVARDPWHDGLPLGGFVRLRDAESRRTARVFIDAKARRRFRDAVVAREKQLCEALRRIGARVGTFDERGDGQLSLARTFGLAADFRFP